jgi:Fe-S cluster biogenesis protein NfuA
MTTIEIKDNVEKALEEIRPFLNSDGGNISLVEIIDDKHVKVRLKVLVQIVV